VFIKSHIKRGTKTPWLIGYKASKGVCPSVPQIPISWLGHKAPAKWEDGYEGLKKHMEVS